jgi:hypothetical protein
MIGRNFNHFKKPAACAFVIEVVERFVTFGAQGVELIGRLRG